MSDLDAFSQDFSTFTAGAFHVDFELLSVLACISACARELEDCGFARKRVYIEVVPPPCYFCFSSTAASLPRIFPSITLPILCFEHFFKHVIDYLYEHFIKPYSEHCSEHFPEHFFEKLIYLSHFQYLPSNTCSIYIIIYHIIYMYDT